MKNGTGKAKVAISEEENDSTSSSLDSGTESDDECLFVNIISI